MPISVMIAVAIMSLIVAANLYNVGFGGNTVVSILLLLGFVKGHRLAWQWGRIFPFLGGVGIVAALFIPVISTGRFDLEWIYLGLAVMCITLVVALGRSSARAYFNLICPRCGKSTWRSANFLFTKAKCKPCDFIW